MSLRNKTSPFYKMGRFCFYLFQTFVFNKYRITVSALCSPNKHGIQLLVPKKDFLKLVPSVIFKLLSSGVSVENTAFTPLLTPIFRKRFRITFAKGQTSVLLMSFTTILLAVIFPPAPIFEITLTPFFFAATIKFNLGVILSMQSST